MTYRKIYEVYEEGKYQMTGTIAEISEHFEVAHQSVRNWIHRPNYRVVTHVANQYQAYAFYDGEELVATGSVYNIADTLNMSVELVRWYGYPSAQARNDKALIKLEGETVIEKKWKNIVAPKPENDEQVPKKEITYTVTPLEQREFKFDNPWIRHQIDGMFRNWG